MIKDLNKYLTDQEFFTYVKFFDMIIEENNIENEDLDGINMHQFSIAKDDSYQIFSRLYDFVQHKDVLVKVTNSKSMRDSVGTYKKDTDDQNYPSKTELEKISNKISADNPIKFSDTGRLSWAWFEVYNSTYFLPQENKIQDKIKLEIRSKINSYLENLINGKLSITKNNYYKFDVLKELFIEMLEEKNVLRLFGENFVIKEELTENGNLKKDPNFCLLQTVYALQNLGYLTVNNIWRDYEPYNSNKFSTEERYFISINITLNKSLITEINNKYKKENPENILTTFNKEKGLLKFAGEDITLSINGKETDACLLMNTLFKQNNSEWVYNDQIFEDWSFNQADIDSSPKNKIYFAAKKINEKVAMKTKIEDFIEFTTEKVRINPRYNKIDE